MSQNGRACHKGPSRSSCRISNLVRLPMAVWRLRNCERSSCLVGFRIICSSVDETQVTDVSYQYITAVQSCERRSRSINEGLGPSVPGAISSKFDECTIAPDVLLLLFSFNFLALGPARARCSNTRGSWRGRPRGMHCIAAHSSGRRRRRRRPGGTSDLRLAQGS